MPLEAEADQPADLHLLLGSHYLLADLLIGDTVGIGTGLCIFREIFEIVGHGKVEQGEPVIEDGCGGKNCSCVVVPQQPKVSEVPILVVDQGIEHQHTAKLLIEIVAQVFVVVKASFQRGLPDNPPDGDKRRVYIRKELALGGEDPFPVFKVISDAGNAHRFRHLAGVILAVRFVAGVGCALRAALVEIDAVVLHESPRLPQHTVCGQLR